MLVLALVLAFAPPTDTQPPHLRAEPPPAPAARLDTQLLLANNVYSLGSQNQNWYATLLTARLAWGIPAISGLLHTAVGAPFRVRGSAASRDRGTILDAGLGLRTSPIRRGPFRAGAWALLGVERQARHTIVDVPQASEPSGLARYEQRRVAWHMGPELGLEVGVAIPSNALAERDLRLVITGGTSLRLTLPLGVRREVSGPGTDPTTIRPDPTSLAILGPLGGATIAVLLGATLEWDTPRRRPSP